MNIPIISKLIKARDKPKDYYSGSNYTYLFGPTTSGKTVNVECYHKSTDKNARK